MLYTPMQALLCEEPRAVNTVGYGEQPCLHTMLSWLHVDTSVML